MAANRSQTLPSAALVADIGGTNARFASADLGTLQLSSRGSFRCAEFPSLQAAAAAYLADFSERPTATALAVAAPVLGETVQFTNSSWSFGLEDLRTALG